VIVVNWNGRHLLADCLDSILYQEDAGLEIIVVDNGSRDGSVEFLGSRYAGKIRLIELPSNEGWSGGNNKGIESARGEYVLLLNNDTCLGSGFFSRLREGILRHPGAGMYATKILDYYDRSVIDNTGHVIYMDGTARGRGRRKKDAPGNDREEEVLCPSGAAGVYRREIFERVGPIDDVYFTYGEDAELGLRARRAGYKCFFIPSAVLYHKYSASSGPYTPMKIYYVERNRIWTVIKIFPWYAVVLSPIFTFARYMVGLAGLISGKGAVGKLSENYGAGDIFLSLLKAHGDALKGIPGMLRKRRALRRVFVSGDREFMEDLARFPARIGEVSFND
jgi:GT2 family glycosyltransferase